MHNPLHDIMLTRLAFVYGEELAPEILAAIEALMASYAGRMPKQAEGWSQRDAFLISYADSILGEEPPLRVLDGFLREQASDLLSFVHLLPFYPFTSDDGFAVQDFRAVREDLGAWDDVSRMAKHFRVVFDGVINHVSASSIYAEGYFAGDSRYADFFISLPPDTDTSSVLRTRNLPLLHDYQTSEGTKWLWTTFSRDQLDLNYANPKVLLEIIDVLLFYAAKGAAMIRLDAIPYMWKELGTSCAHLPQMHELIKLFRDIYDVAAPQVLLLTETNVPHHENVRYFGDKGDEAQLIYNFTLAPLILWSLVKGNASTLTNWAQGIEFISERATYLNVTATHDGIGMRPTEGILSEPERMELVQLAYDHQGDMTGKRNSDGSVSPYELNLNFFNAVNDPRSEEPLETQLRRFLVSQAIPMAMMGIPGLYIHSLLGSRNDLDGVQRTGRARSINREQLHIDALTETLADPASLRAQVFTALARMLRLRGAQSAFHPNAAQQILDLGTGLFAVRRHNEETGETILALHNVTSEQQRVTLGEAYHDLLADDEACAGEVVLGAYQVRWLK